MNQLGLIVYNAMLASAADGLVEISMRFRYVHLPSTQYRTSLGDSYLFEQYVPYHYLVHGGVRVRAVHK